MPGLSKNVRNIVVSNTYNEYSCFFELKDFYFIRMEHSNTTVIIGMVHARIHGHCISKKMPRVVVQCSKMEVEDQRIGK